MNDLPCLDFINQKELSVQKILAIIDAALQHDIDLSVRFSQFIDNQIRHHYKRLLDEKYQRCCDFESALAVALAHKYNDRKSYFLTVLEKWKHASSVKWDWAIEAINKQKNVGAK